MSTKIYSGYILPVTTIRGLFRWKNRVQTLFEAGCAERLSLELAKRSIHYIDKQLTAEVLKVEYTIPVVHSPYMTHAAELAKHTIESDLEESLSHCLRDDYEFSLSVLFARGKCLGILHNNSNYCTKFFNAHSNARPFPYWNNSEPDARVTSANWNLREKIWNEALPGAGVPSECGFHFKTKDPQMYLWDRSESLTLQPKIVRARNLANDYLCNLGCSTIAKDAPLHKYVEVLDKVKSEPSKVEDLARLIRPHLKNFASWKKMASFPLKVKYEPITSST